MPRRKAPIPLYFTSLEVENVRCFGERQLLDLTSKDGRPARWTLILGDNGVGKTTLLQCLAWMRVVPESGFVGLAEEGDDTGEPLPLTKGKLGPALPNEENEVLESLLRAGSSKELTLDVKLALGAKLSSDDSNAQSITAKGKTLRTGVQLFFDANRLLLEFKYRGRPTIERTLEGEFHEPLVVAYGANRQLGVRNVATGDLDDPIASRLSGLTELYDIEEILSGLDYASRKRQRARRERETLDRLLKALVQILPENFKRADIKIHPPDAFSPDWRPGELRVKTFSGVVPLSALSLGFQTTLAWTTDLAWRLTRRYSGSPNPLAEPALVLIDEIDLHLHPLWQLRIIDDLSSVFTGTQFVATSHSPLMVQVAETANFALLRKRESDVEIVSDPDIVRSWRVDQILTSQLFNIPRARNKQTEALFARRAELLDNPARSTAEEAELNELRLKISNLPTAQDPEDQKAIDYIRQAAALLKSRRVVE